jgi:hypothetical protein
MIFLKETPEYTRMGVSLERTAAFEGLANQRPF